MKNHPNSKSSTSRTSIFIGLLLITFAALPLVLFQGNSQKLNAVAMAFGAGLSLVLNPDA